MLVQDVLLEVVALLEADATQVTHVWSLVRVGAYVVLEVRVLVEQLAAVWTRPLVHLWRRSAQQTTASLDATGGLVARRPFELFGGFEVTEVRWVRG